MDRLRQTTGISTPKISSGMKSPPLTTSQASNFPPSHHVHGHGDTSISSIISPKEGGGGTTRLKIKAAMTPESKSRVLIKPGMKTPSTARSLPPVPPLPNIMATPSMRLVTRTLTPSDSSESLFIPTPNSGVTQSLLPPPMEDFQAALAETEAVLVSVRIRPPNPVELRAGAECVWSMPFHDPHVIKLNKGIEGVREDRDWIFDRILQPDTDNARAYTNSARTHVRSAMEGYNAVIFAYGQTASGKTHTLTGSPSEPGIIPLSISDLFAQIRSTPDREFLLRASYLELYNETIIDLLSPVPGQELHLSESKKGVVVSGLTECAVRTEDEVRRLLKSGEERRSVGATDWNARSSRSHCVFRITIESRSRSGAVDEGPIGARTPGGRLKSAGDKMTRISTLSIIDLAGSEKHTSSKERNAEGKHINQSLLTLKLVISKLADLASKRNVTHVPYRDSKLTRLLQNSLSGDALISVICTVSPSALNLAESISTLAFAQGLKRVVLKAQKKEVVDPQALIQQYQNEIAELRALLREKETDGEVVTSSKTEREKNNAMEKRLNELKSMILTSVNVNTPTPASQVTMPPPSPAKMQYPKLDYDMSTAELQEELHEEQMQRAQLEDEVARLKAELAKRPIEPDVQVVRLQDEVSELRLIAEDYERHLLEPSRKVRADVEKEYEGKLKNLELMLGSKKIWANRLDENVRFLTAQNRDLQVRCDEAESKVSQIIEWINLALSPDSSSFSSNEDSFPSTRSEYPQTQSRYQNQNQIPSLIVSNDDFSPSISGMNMNTNTKSTLTLSASKMRATFSQMDLANFNDKFGTLQVTRGTGTIGRGASKMLREESHFDLAETAGDDDDDDDDGMY